MINNKALNQKFNIPNWVKGATPAEEASSVKKRFQDRTDKASTETMEEILQSIADKQEFVKEMQNPEPPQEGMEQGAPQGGQPPMNPMDMQALMGQQGGQPMQPGMEQQGMQQPQGGPQQFADGGPVGVQDYWGSAEEGADAYNTSDAVNKGLGTVANINPIVGAAYQAAGYLGTPKDKTGTLAGNTLRNFTRPAEQDAALKESGWKGPSVTMMNALGPVGGMVVRDAKRQMLTDNQNSAALEFNNKISGRGAELGSTGMQTQQQLAGGNGSKLAYGGMVDGVNAAPCGGPGQVPCKEEKQGFDWMGLTNSVIGAAGAAYGAGAFSGGSGGGEQLAYGGKVKQYVLGGSTDTCPDGSSPPCNGLGDFRDPAQAPIEYKPTGGPDINKLPSMAGRAPTPNYAGGFGVRDYVTANSTPPVEPKKDSFGKKALDWAGRNYDNAGMVIPLINAFNKYEAGPTSRRDTINPNYKQTPTDLAANKNIVAEQASAARRAALGSAAGSSTAYKRMATGINAGSLKGVSEAYRAGEAVNREQQHLSNLYGQKAGMFNASQSNLDLTDKRVDAGMLSTAKMANKTAVLEDASAVLRNMGDEQTIKTMFGYTRKGKYWYKPDGSKATAEELTEAQRLIIERKKKENV